VPLLSFLRARSRNGNQEKAITLRRRHVPEGLTQRFQRIFRVVRWTMARDFQFSEFIILQTFATFV
jgi:hypothetical protein